MSFLGKFTAGFQKNVEDCKDLFGLILLVDLCFKNNVYIDIKDCTG